MTAASLGGQVALVTGAAGGLGAAIAALLARRGAAVALGDIRARECEALATRLRDAGHTVLALPLDVTDAASWQAACGTIAAQFGRLDILVSNAAVILRKGVVDATPDDWRRVLDVNLTGAFLGIRAAAPLMRPTGGAIVLVGSTAGLTAHGDAAYTASKWGLRGLLRAAALELVTSNIRVNAVHPATIATPMTEAGPPGHLAANRAAIPLGREARAEEIAEVVAFLAAPQASFVTGAEIAADGGLTAGGIAWMRARLQAKFAQAEHGAD
ncbi:SDR family NAD(P)-dependent oxidoreductase [Elioraea sp.]|uniref:SDR family NAD(P)-dependent oxidoreductase n=1 Tax=Elioraea sp. TaxID=2185103 RepID=UPI003F6F7649